MRNFSVKVAFSLFISLLFVISISAEQTAEVVFIVGKGTVVEAGKKKQLQSGMILSGNAQIQLEKKSYLTVRMSGKLYTIRSIKRIRIADFAQSGNSDAGVSPLMKIFEKVKSTPKTEVLAVRAEKAPDSSGVVWAEDDYYKTDSDDGAQIYAKLGEMMSKGNYADVIRLYGENQGNFSGKKDDATFLAALSYFYLCRYDESLVLMKPLCDSAVELSLRENAQFYTAFALHSSLQFEESNRYLERFFRTAGKNPSASYALYIMGLNFEALKKQNNALECFRSIVEKYPDDPIASDAKNYLDMRGGKK